MTIRKRNAFWIVTPKDSERVLGKHKTREKALAQLAAIEASKKRRKK